MKWFALCRIWAAATVACMTRAMPSDNTLTKLPGVAGVYGVSVPARFNWFFGRRSGLKEEIYAEVTEELTASPSGDRRVSVSIHFYTYVQFTAKLQYSDDEYTEVEPLKIADGPDPLMGAFGTSYPSDGDLLMSVFENGRYFFRKTPQGFSLMRDPASKGCNGWVRELRFVDVDVRDSGKGNLRRSNSDGAVEDSRISKVEKVDPALLDLNGVWKLSKFAGAQKELPKRPYGLLKVTETIRREVEERADHIVKFDMTPASTAEFVAGVKLPDNYLTLRRMQLVAPEEFPHMRDVQSYIIDVLCGRKTRVKVENHDTLSFYDDSHEEEPLRLQFTREHVRAPANTGSGGDSSHGVHASS